MTGAAVGLAAVGAAGSLIGGSGASGAASMSSNESIAAQIRTQQYGNMKIKQNQSILDDWESMFGGIEQNLSDYYSNLDPVKFAMQQKTNLNEYIDKQLKQVNDTLSAQGLQSSGMRSQAMKEGAFAKATGAAEADLAAPEQVASMQNSWLNSNRQEKYTAQQNISNAYTEMSGQSAQIGMQSSANYANQASQARQADAADTAGWMSFAGSALGAGISGMNTSSPTTIGSQGGQGPQTLRNNVYQGGDSMASLLRG